MALRATKPVINVGQKLAELDRPVGNHGSQLMNSASCADSFNLVQAGRKNMIINGGMNINQRNGGSSYTIPNATGGSYGGPDRWAVNEATGGQVSVNMDGDPLNYPQVSHFSKAFQIACAGSDTSMGSTENTHFFQNIEGYNTVHLGWGSPEAKPVTLSFWVKTNQTGVYCVGLENNATNRCCIKEFYHDGSHTWQKFALTYPGCPDGTWEKTNGCGIRVRFCLASGDTYDDGKDGQWVNSDELVIGSSQTNFMDSTNNRFFITGVQLEEGMEATPFEVRSYYEELSLCQRYYIKDTRTRGNGGTSVVTSSLDSVAGVDVDFPVTMRTSPSLAFLGTTYRNGGNSDAQVITDTGFTWGRKRTGAGGGAGSYEAIAAYIIGGYTATSEL